MSFRLEELRNISTEDLVKRHDHAAENTVVGVDYYLDELSRRDQEAQTRAMLRLTWLIAGMTGVMVVATIFNVLLFALS